MCSIQNVNTFGGSRNKLPSKITEVSVTKPNYAEVDFSVFVRVTKVDIREEIVNDFRKQSNEDGRQSIVIVSSSRF
jgi:hypothetical protein